MVKLATCAIVFRLAVSDPAVIEKSKRWLFSWLLAVVLSAALAIELNVIDVRLKVIAKVTGLSKNCGFMQTPKYMGHTKKV
jgi:hypothetical protein